MEGCRATPKVKGGLESTPSRPQFYAHSPANPRKNPAKFQCFIYAMPQSRPVSQNRPYRKPLRKVFRQN